MSPRLPNLIIVGVTKGGTTSLFRYLAQHPDICASANKELRYFLPLRFDQPLTPVESYAEHFRHWGHERYAMEASPGYFYGGGAVANGIEQTLTDPRAIVSLRDPVQRCWSWFRFARSRARVPKGMTFPAYLDRCEQLEQEGLLTLRENQPFLGIVGGYYDRWIGPWLEVFGDRVRVEFFEDLVREPQAAVAEVCGWLGIDADVTTTFRYDVENKTVQYRYRPLQRLALRANRRTEGFFERRPGLKRAMRGAYYLLNSEASGNGLDEESRQRLHALYGPHNERLAVALADAGRPRSAGWLSHASS